MQFGNLTEHAVGCGRMHNLNFRHLMGRKPFAGGSAAKQYVPDLDVRVKHVKLVASVDPERGKFSAVCSTKVEPIADELDQVFFAAQEMVVESVSLAGSGAQLTHEENDAGTGFYVKLPKSIQPGEEVEISIAYRLEKPRKGIYFTGPGMLSPNRPYQVFTQGEAEDAHYWYPVAGADYPNHKMTTELVVTVPDKYTAVSNGYLEGDAAVSNADGSKTWHWVQDKKHTSYLVSLCIGKFQRLKDMYKNIPVDVYVDISLLPHAKRYFVRTAKLVAHLSVLYGVEYPWAKYAQVFVQDFMFGGMENTSKSTMTDRILADDRALEEYVMYQLKLDVHELAHQWFGDLITCLGWMHIWLNEGLGATYSEVLGVEFFYDRKERDYYVKGVADIYMSEDRSYRRPLVTANYRDPMEMFDRHTYQGGALRAHMLRYLLEDRKFFASMKTFLEDNAYQCVTTEDLIKAITKTTGKNMREFFDQWVYGAGFPEYKVSYSWDMKKKRATVKVSQTQKLDAHTGLFTMPVQLRFVLADGKTVSPPPVMVKDKEHSFDIELDSKPVSFAFDPDGWIAKRVDLSGVPRAMLIHQLHNDEQVMPRIHAAETLSSPKLAGPDAISALEKAVVSNFHWGVSAEAAKCLGNIGTPQALEALKRAIAVADPKVRRAVVSALGNFRDDTVSDLLSGILTSGTETSYFVLGEAAHALGKTKSGKAFDSLKDALQIPSWNELVKVGVFNGLAALGDDRGVDLACDAARLGQPALARPAAIIALGKLGKKHEKAREALFTLAQSGEIDEFNVHMAVIAALGETKNQKAKRYLEQVGIGAADGRLRTAAELAIRTVDSAREDDKDELEAVKTELSEVRNQLKEISNRLSSDDESDS